MIDIIFVVLMIIAVIKGLRQGLIVAVFSIVAYIIGIAAALKLSAATAVYLEKNISVPGKWLPFISFTSVFIIVVILVNLAGKLLHRTFEAALGGWINRLAGAALYMLLYCIIFSVFLFYAEKMSFFQTATIQQSLAWSYIRPWAPKLMAGFGRLIPVFKDSFMQLEAFFQTLSGKIR